MNSLLAFGVRVTEGVLAIAALLKDPAAPGLVTVGLGLLFIAGVVRFEQRTNRRLAAIRWLSRLNEGAANGATFSQAIEKLDARIESEAKGGPRRRIASAWQEYRETFVDHEEDDVVILRNSVRPTLFFNTDDLEFGAGFWPIVPGLFVTGGLFLTFLGLISALHAMDLEADKIQNSLKALLTIASAKFIMSLTGLLCSILFTIVLRVGLGRVDEAFTDYALRSKTSHLH